ncbi:MAG: alpha/beta hydrolase [Candidatus Reddybacter sp.]
MKDFLKKGSFLVSALFLSLPTLAEPVQINPAELKLNGNLVAAEDKQQAAFIIVHGTWAHAAMELPATLQGLLEDEGYASLAITLSLGVDNRQGFFDCKSPIIHGHDEAIDDIHTWYLFLREQGYSKVVLIAHSRGGAQAALYQQRYPQDSLAALVLIGPMTWQQGVEAKNYRDKYGVNLNELLAQAEQYQQAGKALFTPPGVLYCDQTSISPSAFRSYYSAMPEKNTPALLRNTAVQTLVYLGSEDPLSVRFAEQRALFAVEGGVAVVIVDGADHFFRDLYADELLEDLLPRLP